MPSDPIVEEVHRIREKLAARFDFDIDRMVEYARQCDLQGDRRVVSRPRRIPIANISDVGRVETTATHPEGS